MTKHVPFYSAFKIVALLLFYTLNSYAQYPDAVEQNLIKAGNNRPELEKAIVHCNKTGDSLKLKAIYFLIGNMDIHSTSDYYWVNNEGKKIAYNELEYPVFDQASKVFDSIKVKNPGLKPQTIIYKDLETIKGDFLIDNLEKAFTAWKNSAVKGSSFDTFCEYILPYRMSVEPLQDWRTTYATKFNWITNKIQTLGFEPSLAYVKDEANTWFSNTWRIGGRQEPLPRLGSMQILLRKQGTCEDLADLGVFTMRSLGIPATINVIPYWATSTGAHLNNTFFDGDKKAIPFDYGSEDNNEKLKREPAKVLRFTYSKQPEALASVIDENQIPRGFMREKNYIDVTHEYWQTTDVECSLFPNPTIPKIAYIATFNGLRWQPFWWGKIKNNQTNFTQVCKGTVILPQYYNENKMIPAAYPILVDQTENKVLKPDLQQLQNITISSVTGYLILKLNVSYKLFYWDNDWKLIDNKTVTETTQNLVYEKVPKNALLLLLSSDSKRLERPFVVNDNEVRTWY